MLTFSIKQCSSTSAQILEAYACGWGCPKEDRLQVHRDCSNEMVLSMVLYIYIYGNILSHTVQPVKHIPHQMSTGPWKSSPLEVRSRSSTAAFHRGCEDAAGRCPMDSSLDKRKFRKTPLQQRDLIAADSSGWKRLWVKNLGMFGTPIERIASMLNSSAGGFEPSSSIESVYFIFGCCVDPIKEVGMV